MVLVKMTDAVDVNINKQKSPQKEILKKLRKIILKNFPLIDEGMRFGVPWYSGRFYLVALKDHVNLGFAYGKKLENSGKELTGGGKYMKHISYRSTKDINSVTLNKLLRLTESTYDEVYETKNS